MEIKHSLTESGVRLMTMKPYKYVTDDNDDEDDDGADDDDDRQHES